MGGIGSGGTRENAGRPKGNRIKVQYKINEDLANKVRNCKLFAYDSDVVNYALFRYFEEIEKGMIR